MIARWRQASLRWLLRHPVQLALAVVGIALGVAVVAAVDLTTTSAARAFDLSMQQVTGDATHRVVGPPTGFHEGIYRDLRVERDVHASAPVVEGFAQLDGATLRVLGIDPLAGAGSAARLATVTGERLECLLAQPDTALLAAVTARRHGIDAGDEVTLRVAGESKRVEILGLIEARRRSAASLDGLAVVDLATAQAWFDRLGRLDYIDLEVTPGRAAALAQHLPDGLRIEDAGARSREAREMTAAFRTNLQAMGLLAIVVGVFLIYNTMTFSVIQRRRLIAILRSLGVTRGQIFGQIVAETVLLGALGTALGLAAGVALAHGLIGFVTQTINNLYFVLTVREVFVSPAVLAVAGAIGLGAALLGALGPAAEAAASPPATAGQRSVVERRTRRIVPALAGAGVVVLAIAAILPAIPDGGLWAGFAGLFGLIVGSALVMPGAIVIAAPGLARVLGRFAGVLGRMAARGIDAALSRTALAVIALAIALSATVGVGVMIDSFRSTVADWLERTLAADVYLSGPDRVAARHFAALPGGLAERIEDLDGVTAVSTGWQVEVAGAAGPTPLLALDPAPEGLAGLRFKKGERERALARFRTGEAVLVSEPWAVRHDAGPGDHAVLQTDRGRQRFRIAGVYYDYNTDRGIVMMHRDLYDRWWDESAYSSIGVFIADGADRERVTRAVRRTAAASAEPVRVRDAASIRELSLEVFDQTFAITGVLRTLALGVAFVGVVTALLALQTERRRELAILRATGATPGQVAVQITLQTLAMGLLAGVFALPLGLALAEMLIHVINQRAFGWSIATQVPLSVLAEAMALALGAAVLAAVGPAWRAARLQPADALRSE